MRLTMCEAIAKFWGEFLVSPLYDTGYSEPVEMCGIARETHRKGMIRALAYMKGYADACRLACSFHSRGWRIAELVGLAAGTMLAHVEAETPGEICLDAYRREFAALLAMPNDFSTTTLGLALASPLSRVGQ